MLRRFTWLIALFLLSTAGALAQQADTAVVVGAVTDATGAVIPGVDIRLSHAATGANYSAQDRRERILSDSAGADRRIPHGS